jgi:glyoxylase-like metal-dependent hydrolase (beta-lactamase superfamily II)
MRLRTAAAVTAILMSAGLGLAACNPGAEPADRPAADSRVASADVHPFMIGTLEAWALRDGGLEAPNDGTVLAMGEPKAEVDALLTAAGVPTDPLSLSIQPMLLKTGDRVVLFDSGAGAAFGEAGGKLAASLATAGVTPDQITDILISHAHGDHVGGLVNSDGALTYPNARIRMSAEEWEAWQASGAMPELVAAIAPNVETFADGAEVAPGVTAVPIDGHTPGHTAFEVASGDQRLLYIGDAAHHHVISVQRPDWTIQFDGKPEMAEASRAALWQRAADEDLRLYAVHFPWPGIGHVRRQGETFVWEAEGAASHQAQH